MTAAAAAAAGLGVLSVGFNSNQIKFIFQ